jgi:hypothetical protein
MKNSRIEMLGDQVDLKGGPRDMRPDAFSGGEIDMDASEANLSRRTDPMGRFDGIYDKHVAGGKIEITGSQVPLKETPHRGWDSYETPMSDGSQASESRVSGWPTPRGRR